MHVQKNDSKKIVSIWLTQEEQDNPSLMNKLPELLCYCQKENYYPVVFRSGREELYDSIFLLLHHNREVAAREEMQSDPVFR